METKELKIYLIYESRRDWIDRNTNIHNKEFFARFLASETEIETIKDILMRNGFNVEVLMYPSYTMKQIKEIISKDLKTIVWNLTDGHEEFIGAHVPSFVHFFSKPYIGSPSFVQMLCQNKHMTKLILKDMGIDTPNWIHIDKSSNLDLTDFSGLEYPLFIKPSKYDNSIGTEFINPISNNLFEVIQKINELRLNGIKDILVEEYICGQEITITAMHSDKWYILPIERDYEGEYISSYSKDNEKGFLKNQTIYDDPRLINLGAKIINTLGIKDYCRIDLKIKKNKFYILEINSATFLTTVSFQILAQKFFENTDNMFKELVLNSYNRQLII